MAGHRSLSMEAAPHSAYSLLARAAEKAAKAVLCHEGIRPPKTHSLDALASLCQLITSGGSPSETSRIYPLRRYPQDTRRPREHPSISPRSRR